MKDRIKQFAQDHKVELIAFAVGVGTGTILAARSHKVTGVELIDYGNDDKSILVYKANGLHSRFNTTKKN